MLCKFLSILRIEAQMDYSCLPLINLLFEKEKVSGVRFRPALVRYDSVSVLTLKDLNYVLSCKFTKS